METHPKTPITKDPVTTFKMQVEKLREKHAIPGLSLAVLYRQRILFAEGFGDANLEKNTGNLRNTL
jgi:hypothetical protein